MIKTTSQSQNQPLSPLDATSPAESTATSDAPDATAGDTPGTVRELPRRVPTLTNSPGCAPTSPALKTNVPRRVRSVRVDAWAVPAAASWSLTRATVRKVSRSPRSVDSGLPF
jgi:hypothetical protein